MRDEADNITPDGRESNAGLMNLHVGARLQLFTHRDIKPVQHFSSLIGYVRDEYLLVKLPFTRQGPVPFHDGEKVTVRGFTGTSICSFDSNVIRSFLHPFFYMHLEFPRNVETTGLRAATRVKVSIPARVRLASGESAEVETALTNLSVTGALIESERELNKDQLARLSFMLRHGDHEAQIETDVTVQNANVRKAISAEERDVYQYGVKFFHLEPAQKMLLQLLTYEMLLTDRQKVV